MRALENDKVLFTPDRNLGAWVKRHVTDKEIVIYDGACPTHDVLRGVNVDKAAAGREDAIIIASHKDEVATMVERIEEDGRVRLDPLGGIRPWRYGEGPFDLLGDETVTGVLSVGSTHSSARSPDIAAAKVGKALDWEMCYVQCGLTRDELRAIENEAEARLTAMSASPDKRSITLVA